MSNPLDDFFAEEQERLARQDTKSLKKKRNTASPKPKPQKRSKGSKVSSTPGSRVWVPICACALGAIVSLWALLDPKFYNQLETLSLFEISFPKILAEEGQGPTKEAQGDPPVEAKANTTTTKKSKKGSNPYLMENTSLNTSLEKKRKDLEKKERDLQQLEEALEVKKGEIAKQIEKLETMRREISSVIEEKVTADSVSVDKLVGIYSNMKPAKAAKILSQIDENLTVKVLAKMKKQNVAAILNFIAPKKAQELSEKYAGLSIKKKTAEPKKKK